MIMLDCGHRKIYERSKEPRTDHVRCAECLNPMATDYTENPE